MILVDTSIWIDHFRDKESKLAELLLSTDVLIHPFVIGELACGNIKNRQETLRLLDNLPKVISATNQEVLYFIEKNNLMGRGIGYIDAHLLASTALTNNVRIWTRDKRLKALSISLGLVVEDQ